VALFPNPTLEPVDEDGQVLPIDPVYHRLDLPIITAEGKSGPGDLDPSELRLLAGEIQRLAQGDPELHSSISDFALNPRGDVRARISDSPVNLLFRPGLRSEQIRDGLRVLDDARGKFEEQDVLDVDLRFENQVVVRSGRSGGR
jgi:hypothetical protein